MNCLKVTKNIISEIFLKVQLKLMKFDFLIKLAGKGKWNDHNYIVWFINLNIQN